MKKILFLGSSMLTDIFVEYAKNNGAYTIVCDNTLVSESKAKQTADTYWDIDVMNLAVIEERARKEKINAVMTGASELCIRQASKLSKALGLFFYADEQTLQVTDNKIAFKELCKECGLPVAKDYYLDINFREEDLQNIEYPVVVKPADGWASIGMHICNNEAQLKEGYLDAYQTSQTKKVVVEKYIDGSEIALIYAFVNGIPVLIRGLEYVGNLKNGNNMVFGINFIRNKTSYKNEWEKKINILLNRLGCKHGTGFIQIRKNKSESAVIEMNYRVIGGGEVDSRMTEMYCHILMDNLFFEKSLINFNEDDVWKQTKFVTYILSCREGKICDIQGLDKIKSHGQFMRIEQVKKIGDNITGNSGIRKSVLVTSFYADNAVDCVDYVNKTFKVLDENGQNMIIPVDYNDYLS